MLLVKVHDIHGEGDPGVSLEYVGWHIIVWGLDMGIGLVDGLTLE